jgi:hypothetical protein
LTVVGASLDHITISPVGASIVAGQTVNFATEGFDQYNNDLGSVTGATIFSITPDGSCVAAACTASVAGPHTVTGTDNGKSATATLQVTGSAVDHINLTPPTATIGPDLTVTYSTEAFDQYGNDLGDASGAATYTITPDGTCAGRYCYSTVSGPHTITATYQLKSATASMTVTLGNPTFLTISPTGTTIAAGGHQAYTAQGFDQYRNAFGDVTTATTFSVDNAANPCAANTCTSTVAGQHQVIGIWKGVSTSTGLTVTAGPLASITVLPGSAVLDLGQTLSYDTNGWDAYGNVVTYPADQVSWSVSTGTPGKIIASGGKGSFTASTTTSGSGTVIAKVGTVKGSAAVSVRPGAPTNLKAQKGERRIALSWMSGKADKSFRVYRSTGTGSPVLIASGLTSTSFADTTIRSDTKYTYYVTAVGSTGVESAASNTITVIS